MQRSDATGLRLRSDCVALPGVQNGNRRRRGDRDAMKDEKKKYIVTLEFRQRERFSVEAKDEREAERLALEEMQVGLNAEHYETKIQEE